MREKKSMKERTEEDSRARQERKTDEDRTDEDREEGDTLLMSDASCL